MTKRGKILREPQTGPGLLMVEGQQYQFSLDGVWRSNLPPKAGSTVDVEFDPEGRIVGLTAVSDSQLAKEQADKAMAVARAQGGAILGKIVAAVGVPNLVAAGLLIIGWFFLTTVSVQVMGKVEFTFWQVLGLLNSSNTMEAMDPNGHLSAGLYGFLAFLSLLAPFVQYVWKDKRASLGGTLPLLFMVVIWAVARHALHSAFAGPGGGMDMGSLGEQMQNEAMNAISLGFGAYLSLLVSVYFAAVGVKRFLAAKAAAPKEYATPQKASM